ncbi:IS3 family transposase [Porifericola rhodea]|nr:IS3 family transposase [Porifericola rhodea]WKN33964.1 IS3 family transposase [Porifericola rhodea]WKN33965.1 IS3 family transposase [Porifericola rhodea]
MSLLCRLAGITRSAYYKAAQRQKHDCARDHLVLREVSRIRKDMPNIGVRKLYYLLTPFFSQHHINMGRDKLFSLLRTHSMLAVKRKRKAFTTESHHYLFKYPNLAADIQPKQPHQLWVSDMTYLRTGSRFNYLSLITDAYSRKIIGWSLQPTMHAIGPLDALKMALKQLPDSTTHSLTHHSDRGLQYCCHAYTRLLKRNKITISMTHGSYENGLAERVNGILKDELVRGNYLSFSAALKHVAKSIQIYNHQRPHLSLDYLTPQQAHKRSGPLKKHWQKYNRTHPAVSQKRYLEKILFPVDLKLYQSYCQPADT